MCIASVEHAAVDVVTVFTNVLDGVRFIEQISVIDLVTETGFGVSFGGGVEKDVAEKLHKNAEHAVCDSGRAVILRREKNREPLIWSTVNGQACRRCARLRAWADGRPGPFSHEDRLQERRLRGGRFPESWRVAQASRNGRLRREGRRS